MTDIPHEETIELRTVEFTIVLHWRGFDEDDGFSNFTATVGTFVSKHEYPFGPCAVNGLRRVSRFLDDAQEMCVSLAFQNPDVRVLTLNRKGSILKLAIEFAGKGLREEFALDRPTLEVSQNFLTRYEE